MSKKLIWVANDPKTPNLHSFASPEEVKTYLAWRSQLIAGDPQPTPHSSKEITTASLKAEGLIGLYKERGDDENHRE